MASTYNEKKSSVQDIKLEDIQDTSITRVIATQKGSRLAEALLQEKPRLRSWRMFKLFSILFVTYLCSAQNGFDSNTFGGVSTMPDFKAQFGTNIASTTGFLAAIYVIGTFRSKALRY